MTMEVALLFLSLRAEALSVAKSLRRSNLEGVGESERGEAPLPNTSPSPLKERGTKGVR